MRTIKDLKQNNIIYYTIIYTYLSRDYLVISSRVYAVFFTQNCIVNGEALLTTANYKLDKISPRKYCKHTDEAYLNETQW